MPTATRWWRRRVRTTTIVAHGAYIRIDAGRAEVAFVVADAWQGRGIATIMLAHLAAAAEQHGIATFTAEVMPANHRMVQVFRDSGFPVAVRSKDGAIEIEFPTSLSDDARQRFEERERIAAVAAVRSFLNPRSVAVIGASRRRRTIGAEILNNLVSGGFAGPVYAVNRTPGGSRAARRTRRSLTSPSRWNWRWSRCPPPRSTRSRVSAERPGCARCS